MPADGEDGIDKMQDARWKRVDEMESADWMEIWGVRWKGRDGKVVPALNDNLCCSLDFTGSSPAKTEPTCTVISNNAHGS